MTDGSVNPNEIKSQIVPKKLLLQKHAEMDCLIDLRNVMTEIRIMEMDVTATAKFKIISSAQDSICASQLQAHSVVMVSPRQASENNATITILIMEMDALQHA